MLYSGGVDPVVAAKAMISAIALTMAWHVRQRCTAAATDPTGGDLVPGRDLWISLFGAWTTGDVVPSLILAFGSGFCVIVTLLARSFPTRRVVAGLDHGSGYGGAGRRRHRYPHARVRRWGRDPRGAPERAGDAVRLRVAGRDVARTAGADETDPWRALREVSSARSATGSRAALGGAIVAMGVMAVQARRLPRIAMFGAVVSFVAIVYSMTATTLLSSFFLRGGEQNVASLSSRTIAWSAAFDYSDSNWVRWMGAGLAKKEIPVTGQYWQTQVLESSWISALVHAGRPGALLLIVWTLWAD